MYFVHDKQSTFTLEKQKQFRHQNNVRYAEFRNLQMQ